MRAYILTSGAIFGLITIAHLLRMVMEGRHLVTEPVYILLTIASAALAIWAWRVLAQLNR